MTYQLSDVVKLKQPLTVRAGAGETQQIHEVLARSEAKPGRVRPVTEVALIEDPRRWYTLKEVGCKAGDLRLARRLPEAVRVFPLHSAYDSEAIIIRPMDREDRERYFEQMDAVTDRALEHAFTLGSAEIRFGNNPWIEVWPLTAPSRLDPIVAAVEGTITGVDSRALSRRIRDAGWHWDGEDDPDVDGPTVAYGNDEGLEHTRNWRNRPMMFALYGGMREKGVREYPAHADIYGPGVIYTGTSLVEGEEQLTPLRR